MGKYQIPDEILDAFQVDTFKTLENSYKKELSKGNIKDARDYFTVLHIEHAQDSRIANIPKTDYNKLALELDDLLEMGLSYKNKDLGNVGKYQISDEALDAFQVDTFKTLENSYKKELSSGNIKDAKDYFTILHIQHAQDSRIADIPKPDYKKLDVELDDLLEMAIFHSEKKDDYKSDMQ